MKRIVFTVILLAAVVFTGCTSTQYVISVDNYTNRIQNVKNNLSAQEYELSGHQKENSSNTVVTGVSYSTTAGYGTAMDNDHFTYDHYTFSNRNGDKVEINLKYRIRYSEYSDINYMQSVELLGCETSNANDYNRICGSNSVVNGNLRNIPADIDVEVYEEDKSYAALCFLSLLACCVPLLFLLL